MSWRTLRPPAGRSLTNLGGSQLVEVDDVDVGFVTAGDEATVVQPDRFGRGPTLSLDRQREVDPRGALPVPGLVREQCGGEARIANESDVGAAVAKTRHCVWVNEHLAHGIEVAFEVVEGR